MTHAEACLWLLKTRGNWWVWETFLEGFTKEKKKGHLVYANWQIISEESKIWNTNCQTQGSLKCDICWDVQDCWAGDLHSAQAWVIVSTQPQLLLLCLANLSSWTGCRHPGDCGCHLSLKMYPSLSHLAPNQAAIAGGSEAEGKRWPRWTWSTDVLLERDTAGGCWDSSQLKVLTACQPEFDHWNPQGGRREPMAASCPLTFTYEKQCVFAHVWGGPRGEMKSSAIWRELWRRPKITCAERHSTPLATTEECLVHAAAFRAA